MVLVVIIVIGLVFANGWSKGSSVFGFESPFWNLGLIPILTALVIGACRFGGCDADRRRFVLGFEIFGLAAITAYIVSCSRPARWSLVSALLPFQTGLMLAPDVRMSWKDLTFGRMLGDDGGQFWAHSGHHAERVQGCRQPRDARSDGQLNVRVAYLQPGHAPKAAGGGERYHLGMDGAEAPASRRSQRGCPTRVQSVKDEYARRVTEVRCAHSRLTSNSRCNG
jgi:hypothetical protein